MLSFIDDAKLAFARLTNSPYQIRISRLGLARAVNMPDKANPAWKYLEVATNFKNEINQMVIYQFTNRWHETNNFSNGYWLHKVREPRDIRASLHTPSCNRTCALFYFLQISKLLKFSDKHHHYHCGYHCGRRTTRRLSYLNLY